MADQVNDTKAAETTGTTAEATLITGDNAGADATAGKTLLDQDQDKADDKATDKAGEEGQGKADDKVAEQTVPDKYEDFKVDPEVNVNANMQNEFKEIAKSMKLTQDQAQSLVDLQIKYAKAQGETNMTQYRQTVDAWKKETIQALGNGYQQELGIAAKALNRFGSPELRQLLNDSGLGNHKEVVLFFNKIGKAISEDTMNDNGVSGGKSKTDGEIFYPAMMDSLK